MESLKVYKEFDNLSEGDKQTYLNGFKLGYNISKIKNKNVNVNDLIRTLINYKIQKGNIKPTHTNDVAAIEKSDGKVHVDLPAEKNNELLQNNNTELLTKFEKIIKLCNPNKKSILVASLKEYLFYDKKYNDALVLLKNLRDEIKTNKDSNLWVNQIKYMKVINYYKQKLQLSHDTLQKNISSINDTINININKKKNIIKTLSFDTSSPITDLNNRPSRAKPVVKQVNVAHVPVIEATVDAVEEVEEAEVEVVEEAEVEVVEEATVEVVEEAEVEVVEDAEVEVVEEAEVEVVEEAAVEVEDAEVEVVEVVEDAPVEVVEVVSDVTEEVVAAGAPAVDAPVVDAPVVDAPVVDAPVVDAPAVDAPVVDAHVVDAPVVDAPVVDAPVVDADQADTPVKKTRKKKESSGSDSDTKPKRTRKKKEESGTDVKKPKKPRKKKEISIDA
jgi:hypothetical protein